MILNVQISITTNTITTLAGTSFVWIFNWVGMNIENPGREGGILIKYYMCCQGFLLLRKVHILKYYLLEGSLRVRKTREYSCLKYTLDRYEYLVRSYISPCIWVSEKVSLRVIESVFVILSIIWGQCVLRQVASSSFYQFDSNVPLYKTVQGCKCLQSTISPPVTEHCLPRFQTSKTGRRGHWHQGEIEQGTRIQRA